MIFMLFVSYKYVIWLIMFRDVRNFNVLRFNKYIDNLKNDGN